MDTSLDIRAYNRHAWNRKVEDPNEWTAAVTFEAAGPMLLAVLLLLPAAQSSAEAPVVPEQTIALFNGTNLAGFTTWLVDTKRKDSRRVFTVTNGMIRISGDGLGYLATEREYRDYRLVVEFKWGRTNWSWGNRIGAARDSGIFLHATGPDGNSHDGNGAFCAAIECQVMQGAVGDFLLIRGTAKDGSLIAPRVTAEIARERDHDGWPTWQAGGARETLVRWGRLNWSGKAQEWKDTLDFRGVRDVESPSGEWTRVECVCASDKIRVWVNGVLVNEVSAVFPIHGRILLQCEGSEVFFRKVEVGPVREP